ncbi:MAG: hypothetical protein M5U19_16890 [Microthrixaceae bacterium]|nr:hypothetical protein [Microthrixaceae bacterium]
MLARGGMAAAGWSLANISETDDEHTLVSSVRSIGDLTVAASLGGMIHESAKEVKQRFPARGPWRPLLIGATGAGYALYRSSRSLKTSTSLVQRWTDEDKPANLIGTIGIGVAVSTVGHLLAKAFRGSARGTADFFGPDVPHQIIGRAVNAAAWGVGAPSRTTLECPASPGRTRRSNPDTTNLRHLRTSRADRRRSHRSASWACRAVAT